MSRNQPGTSIIGGLTDAVSALGRGGGHQPAQQSTVVRTECRAARIQAALVEVDEAGHTGSRGDEHRELAHGVPSANINERDIHHVVAVAPINGEFGE